MMQVRYKIILSLLLIAFSVPLNMNTISNINLKNVTSLKEAETVYISNSFGNVATILGAIVLLFASREEPSSSCSSMLPIVCISSATLLLLSTTVAYSTLFLLQDYQIWMSVICILTTCVVMSGSALYTIAANLYTISDTIFLMDSINYNHVGGLIGIVAWIATIPLISEHFVYYSTVLALWLVATSVAILLFWRENGEVGATHEIDTNTYKWNEICEHACKEKSLIISFFLNNVFKSFGFPLQFIVQKQHVQLIQQDIYFVFFDVFLFHGCNLAGSLLHSITRREMNPRSIMIITLCRIFCVGSVTVFSSWRVRESLDEQVLYTLAMALLCFFCGWLNSSICLKLANYPVTLSNVFGYGLHAFAILVGLQASMTLVYLKEFEMF